jgi:signal transduction histidine kinase/ActR/RegA family two-component response regulator
MTGNNAAAGQERMVSLEVFEQLPLPIVAVDAAGKLAWSNALGRSTCPARQLPGLLSGEHGVSRLALHRLAELDDGVVLYRVEDLQSRERQEEEYRRLQKAGALFQVSPGLGHDLKNRLTGVIGNLSLARLMMEEGRGGQDALDAVRDAERAALEADSLVQRFMLFTHNDGLSQQSLDLSAIVQNAAAVALGGSNKKIQLSQHDVPWPLNGNPGQLQQVIQNLLQNAAESMGGGGTIWVEIGNTRFQEGEGGVCGESMVRMGVPGAGDYVQLCVCDEGQGILARDLPHVFEPFFSRKPERQGLGLTVCESVVRWHGGFMEVDSQAGRGTMVCLYLPSRPASGEPAARPVRSQRPAKILVMDDEEMVRDVWERMLQRLGHRCSFASEGGEAIYLYQTAQYSDHPFDLVILDMQVAKGMGAIETLERLKTIDPQVRTVISSGYTQDPLMLRSTEFGFKAALPKPFNLAQLQRLIQDLAG